MNERSVAAMHANLERHTIGVTPVGLTEQALASEPSQRSGRMFRSESAGGGWEGSHDLQVHCNLCMISGPC